MRTFANPVVILCLLLFVLNRFLEWQHIFFKPLYQYLDDLLCMPLVLAVVLAGERMYFSKNSFVLPVKYILVAVLLFSLCFELVLPQISVTYTSDVLDVLCYALGAWLFQATINRPLT